MQTLPKTAVGTMSMIMTTDSTQRHTPVPIHTRLMSQRECLNSHTLVQQLSTSTTKYLQRGKTTGCEMLSSACSAVHSWENSLSCDKRTPYPQKGTGQDYCSGWACPGNHSNPLTPSGSHFSVQEKEEPLAVITLHSLR